VIGVWDAPEEARRVGEEIERLEREGCPLDRVAILVRAQFQTREFEDRFIQIGLAYRIVGGFRFYERAEIRDALAYLRLVGQPSDDLAFERIFNTPKRGLGDKTLEKLFRFARANQVPLLRAAYDIADTDELPARARTRCWRWCAISCAGASRSRRSARPSWPARSWTKAAIPARFRRKRPPRPMAGWKTSPNSSARWKNMKRWAISWST
jgi:superfamily I DNA/RNA helicase